MQKASRLNVVFIGNLLILVLLLSLIGILSSKTPVRAATLVQSAKQTINFVNFRIPLAFTGPTTAGDLQIAVVNVNGTSTIGTNDVGWFTAINQSGVNPSQAIFYKISVGGTTSFLPTFSGTPAGGSEQLYEYAGTEKYLDQVGSATASSTTPSSGTIMTSGSNELLLAAFVTNVVGSFDNASWNDAGEGFTEENDFSLTSRGTYGGGDNFVNVTGTQSVTVSATASGLWRGQIVSFTSTPPPVQAQSPSNPMEQAPEEINVSLLSEVCTTSKNVQLFLHAHNAAYVKISNRPDFSDAQWQPYGIDISYAMIKNWTLTEGDGMKTVYVLFKSPDDVESAIQQASVRLDQTFFCLTPEEHAHVLDAEGKIQAAESDPECLSDYVHAAVEPYLVLSDGTTRGWRDRYVHVTPLSDGQTRYAFEYDGDNTYNDIIVRVQRVDNNVTIYLDKDGVGAPHSIRLRIDAADRATIENRLLWTKGSGTKMEPQTVSLDQYTQLCVSDLVPHPHPGDLFRGGSSDVYYLGKDLKRHAFPNKSIFQSWYPNGADINTVADYQLATIPLGGNVTLRPGLLAQIAGNPSLYAVDIGRQLRLLGSEMLIGLLYGSSWQPFVHVLDAALVSNYVFGSPITSVLDSVVTPTNSTSASIDVWPAAPEESPVFNPYLQKVIDGRVDLEGGGIFPVGDSTLRFRILTKDGQALTTEDLKITDEKRMHLVIIRDNMTGFQHLHPEESNGVWSVRTSFNQVGRYYLFIDIVPEGEPPLILRMPLIVGENPPVGSGFPLPDSTMASVDGPFKVQLLTKDFLIGQEMPLTFLITKDGKPLTDFQEFLGAYGHLTILKHHDLNVFIHTDPPGAVAPENGQIIFLGRFPYAGRYTLYAQFDIGGSVRAFPITVDVTTPAAP